MKAKVEPTEGVNTLTATIGHAQGTYTDLRGEGRAFFISPSAVQWWWMRRIPACALLFCYYHIGRETEYISGEFLPSKHSSLATLDLLSYHGFQGTVIFHFRVAFGVL